MSSFSLIQRKLEQFIKKYYVNELIKGAILFFAIGLLYFLITLLVEYFLWLSPLGRTLLFWMFITVEAGLFIRFIAFPLTRLFKLKKGLTYEEASRLIGDHFPQVNDKLLNVIQLNRNQQASELLMASIDQKAEELQPIPFKSAINFNSNQRYLKYAAIPVLIFILVSVLGDRDIFSSSYKRVVNYNTAYEPPAPFSFYITNDSLVAIENKPFTLTVRTTGEVIPENAEIRFGDELYYLQQTAPGVFQYTFTQLVEPIEFTLAANEVASRPYTLDLVRTPSLIGFELELDYPSHTGKRDEILKSTGNATVPEGTLAKWRLKTKNTDEVALKTVDSIYNFSSNDQYFLLSKPVYRRLDYSITTSNAQLAEYENLSFTIGVVRDAYPEIEVQSKADSTDLETVYHLGQVSDDYGLSKLRLVYYPIGQESEAQEEKLPVTNASVDQFVYTFPGILNLEEGIAYEYYFEVFDNDRVNRYKSTKSSRYSYRKLTKEEREDEQLQQQQQSIQGMDKTLEEMKAQEKRLEELSKLQKEKKDLNWNDKKKLENFIKRQKQQEEMMKNFSKELQKNLEEFQPEEKNNDPFKEQLEDRLEENEEQLKKNEELLEELEKLQEKIDKEELNEKLENLAKQNKNQEKNLEQLLELTKRYYVTKKAEKLAEEIYKLGEKQEQLSEAPEEKNTQEEQEKLNEAFEEYQKQMEELEKENEGLQQPMEIPRDDSGEKQVKKEQENATEDLQQGQPKDAKDNQKKAGEKMKEMGAKMQSQMAAAQMETIEEDTKMLRQILDNLVVFSFEQEALMDDFKITDYGNPIFGKKLNVQNDLKLNFQHIDDSLFSLSLRQPMMSEKINKSLTDVSYNMDKAMERLAENQLRQGIANQQYAVTGANELAILLSDVLNNMQMQMQGSGSGQGQGKGKGQGQGQGQGFQLPDIIEKQKSLSEKMEEGMGKGKAKGEGEGQGEGQEGEGNSKGEGDGQGSGEGSGNQGENGRDGDKNGNGKESQGEGDGGDDEYLQGELYEIYKQQQQLRQALQDRLSKEGLNGKGGDILKQMEGVEQQLLDKGFNQRTLERMLNLQYELLKLDQADFEQGQESKRESSTNTRSYQNTLRLSPEDIKQYFNTTEILNREALPLRQEYKEKVNTYFKKKDD